MARPLKDTVDYFPHDAGASDGDTLTILDGQFGNDGYAFWFKLLERISSTENHVIDVRNSVKWQVFLAKAHFTQARAEAILTLLASLDAIDRQLWECDRIIWCQNLVDRIADAYRNRRLSVPQRPNATVSNAINPVSDATNSISDTDNPQKKRKEIKGNEKKDIYGSFQNVLLTVAEYQKLEERFNSSLKERIEKLSEGIASKGYKYASHYATILSWARRDDGNGHKPTGVSGPNSRTLIPRTQYTRPEELRRGNGSHESSSAGATASVNEGEQL